MAMEITNNYSSYATQSIAGSSTANSAKKKETAKTTEPAGSSKAKKTTDYAKELEKLASSVEFEVGNALSTAKSGKTLTINPKLLEKMQNDPKQEKETKELIKGVESAMNLIDSINKGNGWTVVYKHSYIDENGKYHSVGYYRNDFMLNMSDKLREERRQNSEKLLEKQKEKAAEKEEELQEKLEEKKVVKEEQSADSKVKELLDEKIADSKDGEMYLNETDFKELIEAAKGHDTGKTDTKENMEIGANLDIRA